MQLPPKASYGTDATAFVSTRADTVCSLSYGRIALQARSLPRTEAEATGSGYGATAHLASPFPDSAAGTGMAVRFTA